MKKEAKTYKPGEEAQHLILQIRIAVATGHSEQLSELNAKINHLLTI